MRGTGWPDVPQAQRVQIEQLMCFFRTLLGDQLVGMYLHGSMAMGSFYLEHSDIDLLVVCREPLGHDVQDAIMEELLRRSNHPSPLELHIVTQKALCQQAYPLPFELHYSEQWRERIMQGQWPKGNDPDLAAHLTVLKQRGCCLADAPIDEIIPVVPREEFEKAIRSDIADVQRDIQEKPVYFILNLCRVIWYLREGVICSKDEAGERVFCICQKCIGEQSKLRWIFGEGNRRNLLHRALKRKHLPDMPWARLTCYVIHKKVLAF